MESEQNTTRMSDELRKEKLEAWHRLATRYLQGDNLTDGECRWLQEVSLGGGETVCLNDEEVERMDRAVRHVLWQEQTKKLFRLGRMRGMVAAAVIMVCVVMCGAWFVGHRSQQTRHDDMRIMADNRVKTLSLPDGSVVYLNVGSTLSYNVQDFGRESRDVQLDGEAFFQVVKDASRPFRVKSRQATVTVCGTSFNVKAYPTCKETVVSVRDGKVQVADSTQHHLGTLTANRQLVYDSATGTVRQDDLPWEEAAGWKDGQVVFNGAGMEEICLKASHYYGLRLQPRVDAKVNLCGTYPPDDGGKALLQQLHDIYGIGHREERGYTILYLSWLE